MGEPEPDVFGEWYLLPDGTFWTGQDDTFTLPGRSGDVGWRNDPWTFRREDFHGVPGGSSDSGAYGGSEPEAGGREGPLPWLREILPEECLAQPVSTFSGGMKRRAAVARAMAVPSAILLMDEPFTGLDERTRDEVISYILRYRGDRMLLLTTHEPEDVEKLGAECVRMDKLSSGNASKRENPQKNEEN